MNGAQGGSGVQAQFTWRHSAWKDLEVNDTDSRIPKWYLHPFRRARGSCEGRHRRSPGQIVSAIPHLRVFTPVRKPLAFLDSHQRAGVL